MLAHMAFPEAYLKSYCVTVPYARSTAPERRQDVHTYIFCEPPAVLTLTDLTFAFQTLFDLLCEWLTALPKCTPFPQTAHFAITQSSFSHRIGLLPTTKVIVSETLTDCKLFLFGFSFFAGL